VGIRYGGRDGLMLRGRERGGGCDWIRLAATNGFSRNIILVSTYTHIVYHPSLSDR